MNGRGQSGEGNLRTVTVFPMREIVPALLMLLGLASMSVPTAGASDRRTLGEGADPPVVELLGGHVPADADPAPPSPQSTPVRRVHAVIANEPIPAVRGQ